MPDENTPMHRTENDLCIREMDYVIKHSEDAAELLARSVPAPFDNKRIHRNRVLAALRDFGWVHTDFKNQKGDRHNLPKRELSEAGLLAKYNSPYKLRGETKIQKEKWLVLISAKALKLIEHYFNTGNHPELKLNSSVTTEHKPKNVTPLPRSNVKAKQNSAARLSVLEELKNL